MTLLEFPTRLADLSLKDSNHNPSLYANLKSIRRSTLSIPNRLESILEDARFSKKVSQHYGLPLVANERCGSWYIDPTDKADSAYFKSTDGHHGHWDFSARRLNLQLLSLLAAYGGVVVVDSTRRGKNLPDAFSKTVPMWVTVINRALFPEITSMHLLQSPHSPNELSPSEVSQIEARLDGFTETFCSLGLDLQRLRGQLRKPIVVSWAINGQFDYNDASMSDYRATSPQSCHHLVLCSASRRVRGSEIAEGGYIQGAGDDNESWSHGLTPQLYWANQELLRWASEGELPTLIEGLVQQEGNNRSLSTQTVAVLPASNIHIAIGPLVSLNGFDLIINCEGEARSSTLGVVYLNCRTAKLGSKDLREKLPDAVTAVSSCVSKSAQSQILITCSTGKDLSIGVAVAVLCLLYDEHGETVSLRLQEAWLT